MTGRPWNKLRALLDQVADLPEGEREARLESACADDAELRSQLASLVSKTSGPGFGSAARSTFVAAAEATGMPSIAGYRVVRRVGDGGMGEVYEAEQLEPVRRRVAVKIIRAGFDTEQVLQRFAVEKQALAVMDHPAIARVFDAGLTAAGRPFFSMELIAGPSITDYCDEKRLGIDARLHLFCQVCEGVFHAHLKGIVHRDLKPTNVLISTVEGAVLPKIIDFGVSKALSSPARDETLFTEMGVLVGTPEYMSPEQARAGEVDVDVRADVYSLGVLLYELLVGARPFDMRDVGDSGWDGMRRLILEKEPPPPSRRFATIGDRAPEVARLRGSVPSALRRRVTGDLDRIAMKALEKDRAQRYASPLALAEDIRHHLAHEPIAARPPDALDQVRRFVRRHRIGVGVATAALLTLVAFTAVTLLQSRRIARERDRANLEAETSASVSRFLAGLFKESDPDTARGQERTAREILDRGAASVSIELADEPAVRARVMDSLGRVYRELGDLDRSRALLEGALATRREHLGNDHVETAISMLTLANTYQALGRPEDALALDRESIPIFERELGAENQTTLRAKAAYAGRLIEVERYADARDVLLPVLAIQRRTLGRDYHDTLYTEAALAEIDLHRGDLDSGIPALADVLERLRVARGSDHPNTLSFMVVLADAYLKQGRDDLAEPLLVEALAGQRKIYGGERDETKETERKLAALHEASSLP